MDNDIFKIEKSSEPIETVGLGWYVGNPDSDCLFEKIVDSSDNISVLGLVCQCKKCTFR